MLNKLIQEFQKLYGAEGELRTYFAPGRVNLIGEHTDYNGMCSPVPSPLALMQWYGTGKTGGFASIL